MISVLDDRALEVLDSDADRKQTAQPMVASAEQEMREPVELGAESAADAPSDLRNDLGTVRGFEHHEAQ